MSDPQIAFAPARSKLEAVTRIGALTGTDQTLGPGSKERKAALVAINDTLSAGADTSQSKPALGADLAARLDTTWASDCYSTGHTITLVGLNRLLGALEARAPRPVDRSARSPQSEAERILGLLASVLTRPWDGKACVDEMRRADSANWAQDEWAGFYFEFKALPACIRRFGGGPVQYGNTRFDYEGTFVWDLKWHGGRSTSAPLNDARAIDACVDERGLGFILLSGSVVYDDGQFREWQRKHRLRHGKRPSPRAHPPKYQRSSKVAFTPEKLEAFFLADRAAVATASAAGALARMAQGRQVSGAPRAPKYALNLPAARETCRVAERLLLLPPLG